MTDKETASHLRWWVAGPPRRHFSWPTDGCGYDQHIRFVRHRNEHWHGEARDFGAFVLAYADTLDPRTAAPLSGDTYPGRRHRPPTAGRVTRPRASERRKLIRLADELGDAVAKYGARLSIGDVVHVAHVAALLGRLAADMDTERDAPTDG